MSGEEHTPHIKLIKDGPLKISGSFTLVNDKNEKLNSGKELYLCRCGKSASQPYCDGTHKQASAPEKKSKENCD